MRQRLARLLARTPVLGKLYLKGMLKAIDRTPREKLPPEMQQLQTMLRQIPEDQRVPLMQAAMKGELPAPEPGQMSREMRRATAKQARRKR